MYTVSTETNEAVTNEMKPLIVTIRRNMEGFCELNYRVILAVLSGSNLADKRDILEAMRWVSIFGPQFQWGET